MSGTLTATIKSTSVEVALFEAWNAVELLALLNNPAIGAFGEWVDAELAGLESAWMHAAPPNALREKKNNWGTRIRT
jgi:hypothetical protein